MGQKFFNVFHDLSAAQDFIIRNSYLILEINSEVFSDGLILVKYRTEHGKLN